MENNKEMKKMNVLVTGTSGAGKSTLIKNVSGIKVETGVGEGNTTDIGVYVSNTWPMNFIDTKGFEYKYIAQMKTINQIKKFTKKQIKKESSDMGIDAVWYCVDGTSRRIFTDNIKLMKKSIKGWKNIPIYAVLTKSYSEKDIVENVEAIEKAFSQINDINFKGTFPVVAEEYVINDETKVAPRGIEDLCLKTLDGYEEAKNISKENMDRMVLEQKRISANSAVIGATTSAVVIGAIPVPISDAVILVPLETGLTKLIFKIYKIDYSGELVSAIVGSTVISQVAKSIVKAIPVAGAVVNGVVAGAIVFALGEGVIAVSESIYKGKIEVTKINEIVDIINDKLKDNVIIKNTISYFEENADKLKEKKAKDIFTEILRKSK